MLRAAQKRIVQKLCVLFRFQCNMFFAGTLFTLTKLQPKDVAERQITNMTRELQFIKGNIHLKPVSISTLCILCSMYYEL